MTAFQLHHTVYTSAALYIQYDVAEKRATVNYRERDQKTKRFKIIPVKYCPYL